MPRPEVIIDWKKVDGYLRAQCDGVGIAGILGIAPITLYRACKRKFNVSFDAYSQKKRSEGVELLKAKQFSTAMEGNVTMQIWLGKQYAGQRDKQEIDHTITADSDLLKKARERASQIADEESK